MRFAIYTHSQADQISELLKAIEFHNSSYELNPCTADGFDMAISHGGDGTFLSSARKILGSQIPLLGINGGRLGFLANTTPNQTIDTIAQIHKGGYEIEHRTMIRVKGIEARHGDALNEFTLQKRTCAMIHIAIKVDNAEVAAYWADGVIVSTPTGSTAYSMSVGGAIVSPKCQCLIISPIAPHNLNIRPIVVSDTSKIELSINTRNTDSATATIDNRDFEINSNAHFMLECSPEKLAVAVPHSQSFYQTLRDKLHWGVDVRGN